MSTKYHFQPNILIVRGMPSNGKTTFSREYVKENTNAHIIHSDVFFQSMHHLFPEENNIKKNFDVFQFLQHPSFDKNVFLSIFKDNLNIFSKDNIYLKTLIVEGYACLFLYDDIIKILRDNFSDIFTINCELKSQGYSISYKENCWIVPKSGSYQKIIKELDLIMINEANLDKRISYQQFDWSSTINSNSNLKYQKTFSKIDLTNKSFLDIGCNSGLFCFNAKKNQAKSTTGIDINYEFIRLANDINKYKYDFNNMKWVFGDIFEFYPLSTYDMIFCASVFHYFGTKQLDFIKKLHELLDNNGIIYLEVEISPKLDIDVDISTRGNDSQPLHYPTEKGFNVMISELFNIDNKEESAFQPGSLYTRYFYTLVKKYHK